jgi:hypothetical protein
VGYVAVSGSALAVPWVNPSAAHRTPHGPPLRGTGWAGVATPLLHPLDPPTGASADPASRYCDRTVEEPGEWTVSCGQCSLRLDEPRDAKLGTRPPCPECGSFDRAIRWTGPSGAQIMLRDHPQRRPGEKRPRFERWQGDSLSKATGRVMRLIRIVDRKSDRYYEQVHDIETREVIREVDEPLTEHRGRGDARRS